MLGRHIDSAALQCVPATQSKTTSNSGSRFARYCGQGGTLCKGGVGVQADSLLTNDLRDNVIAMVWALCVIWVPWYRGYIQDATCERMLWYGSRCSGEMVPAGPTHALAP